MSIAAVTNGTTELIQSLASIFTQDYGANYGNGIGSIEPAPNCEVLYGQR